MSFTEQCIVAFNFLLSAFMTYGNKIIIDHDGGADDAMAIFIALINEQYFKGDNIIALTISHGNVDEDQAFFNTQRILTVANRRDIPIYRGSKCSLVETYPTDHFFGNDGLGDTPLEKYEPIKPQKSHAALALIEMSKLYKDELTIIALGGLTNIALASTLDPNFIQTLGHLYVAAGNFNETGDGKPEFNARVDVEAYKIVVRNSLPNKVTFIPFSPIIASENISTEWRKKVLGSIPTQKIKALNAYDSIALPKSEYWNYLDPSAVAMIINRNLVKSFVYSQNDIILFGKDRGITTNNITDKKSANVKLMLGIKSKLYCDFLIEIFSAEK